MLSNHDDVFEIEDSQAKRSAKLWSEIVAWTFPVIGVVALELGTPLWVGLLIACLKFGWRDFLAAWWLRSDPFPQRGKSISWILAARGCFLVALGGAVISLCILVGMLMSPEQWDEQQIVQIIVMGPIVIQSSWTVGFILISMGCSFSVRNQIRVWIDDSLYAARRERNWNRVCSLNKNSFHDLCGPPMLHAVVIGGPFALVAFSTGQFGWLLATAATVLGSIEIWRARRRAALVPEDCWRTVEPANSLSSSDQVTSERV